MPELERIATFIEAAKELGYDVIQSPYFDCHQGYAPQTMPCQTPAGQCDCPERAQLFVVRPRGEATDDRCPHCGRGICVGCPLGEATDA